MSVGGIHIGVAGWAYKDWEGIVYPKGLKKKQHPVAYLARFFDMIEINSSFYGHIQPQHGKTWAQNARGVNPTFLFTAKLNRAFTHSPIAVVESTSAATIVPREEEEALAKRGLDSLAAEGCLGAVLAQFPMSFKNTVENRDYLSTLIGRFAEYPLVVEIRHSSWDDPEVLLAFTRKKVAFCNIDQPRLGRSLAPTESVTSTVGYVRLHGRNYKQWFQHEESHERYNYLYAPKELTGWTGRIEQVAEKTASSFVVLNNHFQGKAAVNALQLKNLLSKEPVPAPETLVKHYPELQSPAFIPQ